MKLVKMSLLAATLIASSAFAIDNTKVSGDAKLYYGTNDSGDYSLFDNATSYGQAAASVGLTTDLTEGVSAGVSITALSTMGLETRLVDGVWEAPNALDDYFWFDEAWIAGTVGKTTAKVGRMALDTPLVFTETWSIVSNTFEAAVLINQDIPDTTLVGAYVGGGNGGTVFTTGVVAPVNTNGTTNFSQFYKGAYAAGVVNNSWAPLTAQAWYYQAYANENVAGTVNLTGVNAYWLQADLALDFGLLAGAQYSGGTLTVNDTAAATGSTDIDGTALSAMVGYAMKDMFTVKGAFSQTGEDHSWGMNLTASGQSKLYTEAWWNYGYVTRADTTAMNLTATTAEALTWAELGLFVTQSTTAITGAADLEMTEVTVTATKSAGPVDVTLAVFNTAADDQNNGDSYNSLQAYLAYNF